MNSSSTMSTVTTWILIGQMPDGRIVVGEHVTDAGYARRIASSWRASGLLVTITEAPCWDEGDTANEDRVLPVP